MAVDHAGPATGDAVADAGDLAQLLGVDVDQLARPLALITHSWRPRLERGQPTEPEPAAHQADGGDRLPQPARDLRPGQALPAQALDRVGDLARQPAGRAGGRRAAVV